MVGEENTMANESLIAWLDSLGYPIDKVQNERLLDVFSGLAKWFENNGTRFLELGGSLKRVEILFPDESGFMPDADDKPFFSERAAFDDQNKALGEVFCERFGLISSGVDEDDVFSGQPVFIQTLLEKLDMPASEEETSVNDTLVRFVESSVNRFRESGQFSKPATQIVSDTADSSSTPFVEGSGELAEEADDVSEGTDARTIGLLQEKNDTGSAFHLKMPLDDFLQMKRRNPVEMTDDSKMVKSPVFLTGEDSEKLYRSEEERTYAESASAFSSEKTQMYFISSTDMTSVQGLADWIFPGFTQKNLSERMAEGNSLSGQHEALINEGALQKMLQTSMGKRGLFKKFFGDDAVFSSRNENLMSFRQKWVPDQLMAGQKLMDTMALLKPDSTVLGLPDSLLLQERAARFDMTDAGASNRTINITVNGSVSSGETAQAISQGLMDVDMGMTLRHFKSPMMA